MDVLSLILIIIGAIMTYGAKYILKFLKVDFNDIKVVVFKLIGLIIACIGIFRVLDII